MAENPTIQQQKTRRSPNPAIENESKLRLKSIEQPRTCCHSRQAVEEGKGGVRRRPGGRGEGVAARGLGRAPGKEAAEGRRVEVRTVSLHAAPPPFDGGRCSM